MVLQFQLCNYIYINEKGWLSHYIGGLQVELNDFESQQEQKKKTSAFTASRLALVPSQPTTKWVHGALSPRVKWPVRGADNSHQFSA
jgi:hypothetical protein